MAQQLTINATRRTATGKGVARSLRRRGQVPGVVYGHGRPSEPLALAAAELSRVLTGGSGTTTMVDLVLDGGAPVRALVREIQRNPIKPSDLLHVDLFEVRSDEEIDVEVPVHISGTPEGVRTGGGVLEQALHSLTIRVLPGNLPESITVDVTNLTIGHSILVRDVVVPNAEILNDADIPVVSVIPPRTEAAPSGEAAATQEPELIRKPKPEDSDNE